MKSLLIILINLFLVTFAWANSAPTMNGGQIFSGTQNKTLLFKLIGASDADKDPLTYSLVSQPSSGELKNCLSGTSSLSCEYIPAQGFYGTVTFIYKANDGKVDSVNTAKVTLKINLASHIPDVGGDQQFTTQENTNLSFSLNKGSDANGDTLSYYIVSAPEHGEIKNCLKGTTTLSCIYVPSSHFYGQDHFTYKTNDGISDSTKVATVTINVTQVNHPPVMIGDQEIQTTKNTPVTFNLNGANDIHGDPLTYKIISQPSSGTLQNCFSGLSCTYIPDNNFVGTVSFRYVANDGNSDSATSSLVTILVGRGNTAPQKISDQSFEMNEDQSISFDLSGYTDTDNDFISYRLQASPSVGLLLNCLDFLGSLRCTYIPPKYFHGEVQFSYTANDGIADASEITNVFIKINHVNHAPTMNGDQSFSGNDNAPISFSLAGASDVDRDTLTYSLVSGPQSGELKNCLQGSGALKCDYIPAPSNADQTISFVYRANDGVVNSYNTSKVTILVKHVNIPPVAKFSCSHSALRTITCTSLSSDADGNIVSSEWDFGDGSTASGQNVTHTYSDDGNFSVTLTVTDDQGTSVSKGQSNVRAYYSYSGSTGIAPSDVTFDASGTFSSSSILNYHWAFGDGTQFHTTIPSAQHIFSEAGAYIVTLTAEDGKGGYSSYSNVLVIFENAAPQGEFLIDKKSGISPVSVSFDASSSSDDGQISLYEWSFGDGTTLQSTSPQIQHYYKNAGNFKVKLTVYDNVGKSSVIEKTLDLISNSVPVANIKATPMSGNPTLNVTLDASGSTSIAPIANYHFDFGDGKTLDSNTPQVFHSYEKSGLYKVILTISDTYGLEGKNEVSIRVNEAPIAKLKATPESGQSPLEVTFDASTSTDDSKIQSYVWDLGDGNIQTTSTPVFSHTFLSPDDYTMTLKVIDDNGVESTSASLSISVFDSSVPMASFETDKLHGNPPLTVNFDSSSTTKKEMVTSYSWFFEEKEGGDLTTTSNSLAYTFTTPGTYDVQLVVWNGETPYSTTSKSIRVNAAPIADFKSSSLQGTNPLPISFDASISRDDDKIVSYTWDFGDGSTEKNRSLLATHTYDNPGTYLVRLTITDSDDLSSIKEKTITVTNNLPPVSDFSFEALGVNPPQLVTLDASASTDDEKIVSYEWVIDGEQITTSIPTLKYTFSNFGKILIQLETVDRQGLHSAVVSKEIILNTPPHVIFESDITMGNAPLLVNFDGMSSTDDGTISKYSWNFGDGLNEENTSGKVSHTFTRPGIYSVVMTVTDDKGLSSSEVKTINVAIPPKGSFIMNSAQKTAPMDVAYDADNFGSSTGIVLYEWDFGDGTTLSTTSPYTTHRYDQAGKYIASLTITEKNGSKTTRTHSWIVPENIAPQALASANTISGQAPLSVNFNATQSSDDEKIVQYEWTIDDGKFRAETVTPSWNYVFSDVGEHIVTLRVYDRQGRSDYQRISISVKAANTAPSIAFSMDKEGGNPPLEIKFDATASFDDGSILSYYWDFGDGQKLNERMPITTHKFQKSGDFTITLVITDNEGAKASLSKKIHVNNYPVAKISSSSVYGNSPLNINFNAASSFDDGSIVQYQWDFGDSNYQTGVTADHEFLAPGKHKVTLTVTDELGLTGKSELEIIVNSPPEARFVTDITGGDFPIDVTFNASGSSDDKGIVRYSWDFGDGSAVLETLNSKATHKYTAPGVFSVKLKVFDESGLSAQATADISVHENTPPVADFAFTPETGIAPKAISFDASNSHDDKKITKYSWSFGDGEIQETTALKISHNYSTPGDYLVELVVVDSQNATSSIVKKVTIKENQKPVSQFISRSESMLLPLAIEFDASLSSDDEGIIKYRFEFGDGEIQDSTQPIVAHVYKAFGSYDVKLTTFDRQGSSSSVIQNIVIRKTGVETDLLPPQVIFVPDSNKIGTKTPQVTITLTDETQVDYQRLRLSLNGALIPSEYYTVDKTQNRILINFDENYPLIPEAYNYISVFIGDIYGHVTTATKIYHVLENQIPDTNGPQINFNPMGGTLDTLTPTITVAFADESGIDFNSFEATLNDMPIPSGILTVVSKYNRVLISFTSSFSVPNNTYSILKIRVKDSLGNIGIGSIGFGAQNGSIEIITGNLGIGRGSHSCVIVNDGDLKCWGDNTYGQLGYGQMDKYTTPVVVNSIMDAKEISVGENASCARLLSGELKCWGKNTNGQLGNNSTKTSFIPTIVSSIITATQTSINASHACAVLSDKTIKCWGNNTAGQLGVGTRTSSTIPVVVKNITSAKQVAAGRSFSCAVILDGTVKCWGDNSTGQLGNNSTVDSLIPVAVSNINNAIQIEVGYSHACALLSTGGVQCWGRNNWGQIGTSSPSDSLIPIAVNGITNARNLTAGDTHNCVVLSTGSVQCWGGNIDGQIGNSSPNSMVVIPASVGGITNAINVSAGSNYTCAVLSTGQIQCWGGNSYGQLGNNSTTKSLKPVNVFNLASAVQVEAGATHACALLQNGSVRCWGNNDYYGQTGNNSFGRYLGDTELPSATGVVDLGGKKVVEIATGSSHTCVMFSDKNIRCWGSNSSGQIGSATANTSLLTASQIVDLSIRGEVSNIVSGGTHTCVILKDGSIVCWGGNDYGQLGYGNTNSTFPNPPSSLSPVSVGGAVDSLAIGGFHTCALLKDKTIKCWGDNRYGQLGMGNTNPIGQNNVPSNFSSISVGEPAKQVVVGDCHSCALLESGSVRCWGCGGGGALGKGNIENIGDDEFPSSVGTIKLNGSVVKIASGSDHVCALMTTGVVRCWGVNDGGQLGIGYPNSVGDDETPDTIDALNFGERAVDIKAGWMHTCATLESKRIKCWGYNSVGQLGSGTNKVEYQATVANVLDLGAPLYWGNHISINVNFSASPLFGYPPLAVDFDASTSTSSAGAIISYSWNFGDGTTASLTTPKTKHTFNTSGTYVVKLTVLDSANNVATYERVITTSQDNIAPTANFIADKTFGNSPLVVNFNGADSFDANGRLESYEWNYGDGTTETTLSAFTQHEYQSGGAYMVTLKVTDNEGKSSTSFPQMIVVSSINETPLADFSCTLDARVISCNADKSIDYDGAISGYKWTFSDGTSFIGKNITHRFLDDGQGKYEVKLTVIDDKGATDEKIKLYQVDNVIPIIHIAQSSNILTNNPLFNLDISVEDDSNTTITIYQNQIFLTMLTTKSVSLPVYLTEGVNNFQIEAIDAVGNNALPVMLSNIILDSVPAKLTNISPLDGAIQNALIFEVKGDSDKELLGVMVNGSPATLTNGGRHFSGMISKEQEGPYSVTIEALDRGGNLTTKTISGEIYIPVLTKELITILPTTNPEKIKVVGAPGAVRFPRHSLKVSGGFFNSSTIVSNDNGEFSVELDVSERIKITTEHPSLSKDEVLELSYLADTTLAGVVKDTEGHPLMGVVVTIASSGQKTTTDANGGFSIAGPATGDQKIVIDGTTIPIALRTPERFDNPNKSYSSVSVAVNIGTNQRNILDTPIYLAPLKFETSTAVNASQGASVSNDLEAQGVTLDIPAGTAQFPSGTQTASVNMALVTKDKTTIPTLDIAEPDKVIALEPSGTKFTKPVELTLPNVNEFPVGTEMVILSKNSEKGIWEVDGEAVVTPSNEIVTKEGKGITHFSEVYAVPLGGRFGAIGDQDKPGADTLNGAMSTAIALPSYKSLGEDHAPGLIYKSTWAHPTAIVSNLFDIPRNPNGDPKVWIEPDKITAQFFSENYVSPIMTYEGMPNRSVISYAMDLKNYSSGIHPYHSKYEIHLKEMTLRTRAISRKLGRFSLISQESYVETRKLAQVFPSDVTGSIYVQNKQNSEAGQGWKIAGVQKILNPENSRLLLEEADGNLSVYTLNNAISTIYKDDDGVFAFGFGKLSDSIVVDGKNNISRVNFLTSESDLIGTLQASSGIIGYNFSKPERVCVTKKVSGVKITRCSSPWFCHEFESPFSNKRQAKQLVVTGDGQYVGIDYYGNIFSINGGNVTPLASKEVSVPTYNTDSSICSKDQLTCNGFVNVNNYAAGSCYGPRPSSGKMYKLGFQDGDFSNAEFSNLMGIARAPQDSTVVIADTGNNRIRRLNLSSGLVETIAGTGGNIDLGDGGKATDAGIFHPRGVVYDKAGNLYISTENGIIRKVEPNGYISTFAGDPVNGQFTQNIVHAKKIRFNKPYGLVIDDENNFMYVADTDFHRVVKIDMTTMMATTIAGSGTCNPANDTVSIGEGRPALEASLCSPENLALDENKNLIIQDTGHKRIRRIATMEGSQGKIAFLSSNKDNSILYRNTDGSFERVYRNGAISNFDKDGNQVSSKDRVGRVVSFSYEDGKLVEQTDPVGSKTVYNYVDNKLASIVDPSQKETRFTYTDGKLSRVVFPDNTSKSYSYDSNGLLIEERDQKDNPVTYTYNQWMRLHEVIKSTGEKITINDSASLSAGNNYTGANKGKLSSYGTAQGQVYDGIKDARNIETQMVKDESGYVSTIVDGEGKKTLIDRDLEGRPIKITRPDDTVATFSYDFKTGDLIKKSDSATGVEYIYTYDSYGNLTSTKRNGTLVESSVYNETTGLLSSKTNHLLNQKVSYAYSGMGLVTEVIDPLGRKSKRSYDPFGNVLSVISPEGLVTSYTRDPSGNVVKVVNPNNQATQNEYDEFNRLLSVITPKGETTAYSYSESGELLKITDPQGKKVHFEYDDLGRLIKKTDAVGRMTELFYDGSDNVIKEIDPSGHEKTFSYDRLDRLVKKTLPDNVYELAYDVRGNVTQAKNNHSKIDFAYIHHDAGELVSSVTVDAEGSSGDHAVNTIRYDYNDWGQRISMTSSAGANATYYYDQGNRLARVKNQRGENFDFSYDNGNRLTQIVRPGTKTSFDFDDGDFLTKISHGKVTSGEAVSFFIYVKDPAGNRTQMKTKSGNFDYSYDSNNQVVGATNPEASLNEFFQYDSIGNRTKDASGDIEYDSTKQRIQEDAFFTYTHDNNGNLSSRISKTSDESVNYTHNSENQLIRIEFFKGTTKTKEVQYTYDALGRRIEKAISDIQTPSKSFVRRFAYDGNEIIAERDQNEQTLARYTHSTLRTDDVLSVENSSGSYMYLKDGQGTITDITDSSGNLVQHYSYSAFGKILKITDASGNDVTQNPIINTPFTYTGREYDAESGLYYYRARYYDASMGRFLEQDPDAGKTNAPLTFINKYVYVGNNPQNLIDPTGHKFKLSTHFFAQAIVVGSGGLIGSGIYKLISSQLSEKSQNRFDKLILASALGGAVVASGGIAGTTESGLNSLIFSTASNALMSTSLRGNFVDLILNDSIKGYAMALIYMPLGQYVESSFGAESDLADNIDSLKLFIGGWSYIKRAVNDENGTWGNTRNAPLRDKTGCTPGWDCNNGGIW